MSSKIEIELCEGLQLFHGTDVQNEVEQTFQGLLDAKYKKKQEFFEAHFLFLILQRIRIANQKEEPS